MPRAVKEASCVKNAFTFVASDSLVARIAHHNLLLTPTRATPIIELSFLAFFIRYFARYST